MSAPSDKEKYNKLWEKLEEQELHNLEELAQLLGEAKSAEDRKRAPGAALPDAPQEGHITTQIDSLFKHVMTRLNAESQREAGDLAKRLVALDKLEKGFAGLLVARIEAMDHRIHQLHRERVRLEHLIDKSSRSILGVLWTGLRSQMQLKNVKAELRVLQEEKQRVWQRKEAFNQARAVMLGKSKKGALTILQRLREEGLLVLHDRLLTLMEKELSKAETTKSPGGFVLKDSKESQSPCFGRFVMGLSLKEKEFVDKVSDANNYAHGHADLVGEVESILLEYLEEIVALPNRCLFLAKLLAGRRYESIIPPEVAVKCYRLFDKGKPEVDAIIPCLSTLSPSTILRLERLVHIVRRIAALNSHGSDHPHDKAVRKHLARIFRDLTVRYQDLIPCFADHEKPAIVERRRHQERVNRHLDDTFHYIVEHWEDIAKGLKK